MPSAGAVSPMIERADQRPQHEVVLEKVHPVGHPVGRRHADAGRSSAACGCTWSWPGLGVVAGRLGHRAVVRDPSVVDDDGPVDQRLQRAELVRDQQHRAAVGRRSRRSAPANASWLAASTPAVGSSRTSRSGSPARARAISVRCCWPPDRVATGSPARSARPTAASAARDRGPVGGAGRAAACRGGPAGRRRPPRRRSPARRCRRRAAAARSRSGATAGTGASGRAEQRRPAGRQRDQAEHRPDQCGLAGAVGAQDRDHLAGRRRSARRRAARGGRRSATAAVRDARRRVRHEQPSAGRSVARLVRMTEK